MYFNSGIASIAVHIERERERIPDLTVHQLSAYRHSQTGRRCGRSPRPKAALYFNIGINSSLNSTPYLQRGMFDLDGPPNLAPTNTEHTPKPNARCITKQM